MTIRAREGDFIETYDSIIFDVKGLVHPPDRIIAYARYVKDPEGGRRRENGMYRKVYSLSEREGLLERRFPQYLFFDPVFGERLEGVPHRCVSVWYRPSEKVSELLEASEGDEVEEKALDFIQVLHDSSEVPFGKLGLSGSILVGLHTPRSDIDPIVYGRKNCFAVHKALRRLLEGREGGVSAYGSDGLRALYRFRSRDTAMPWEDFLRIEGRKACQGRFRGRDFFVRFVLDRDEVGEEYGDRRYVPVGYAKIRARVKDASNSIFTPCIYGVSEIEVLEGPRVLPIREITSFRGRFCEQAVEGEMVIAQGKVEKATKEGETPYYRLVLGAQISDFMISEPPS